MSFVEIGNYCSIGEYKNSISLRALEGELESDGLYTMMMRLGDDERKAAKQTVRVEEVSRNTGLVAVKFAFLKEDLTSDWSAIETIHNGLINGFEETEFWDSDEGPTFCIEEAYFKDYVEEQYIKLLDANQKIGVSV